MGWWPVLTDAGQCSSDCPGATYAGANLSIVSNTPDGRSPLFAACVTLLGTVPAAGHITIVLVLLIADLRRYLCPQPTNL